MTRRETQILIKLFVGALAIRWAYVLLLLAGMGNQGFMTEDSANYILRARDFAGTIALGKVSGVDWLGFDPTIMPLFSWLILPHVAFGDFLPLTYVLFQGALDAGTCLLVYRIAGAIDVRYAWPAGWCAALNPTQIVLSGIVLTDTPFVFFIALFLLGSVQWLHKPTPRAALLIATGLAAALLIRILAAPWSLLAFSFLIIVGLIRRQLGPKQLACLLSAALVVAASTGLVLWRNVTKYDAWALTPQGGVHLALWVVPLVKEAKDRTPWAQSKDEMQARWRERFGAPPTNPFEQSRQLEDIGRSALKELGVAAMAKAWTFGAAINLASPGILLSAPLYHSPRTGFYATQGSSFVEKVTNFLLASGNRTYSCGLLLGISGAAVIWVIQAIGIATLFRSAHLAVCGFFALWSCYILAINGPVASPKYRLPLEPPLMVAAGAGLSRLERFRRRPISAAAKMRGAITP